MIVLLLAAALTVTPAQGSVRPDAKKCKKPDFALTTGGRAQFRRLGDLPSADMVMAVLRTKDGCLDPLIRRSGIGRTGAVEPKR